MEIFAGTSPKIHGVAGERASTTRRRLRGEICCQCDRTLAPPHPGRERFCARCDPHPRRVLLNYQSRTPVWIAHFLEEDCRTPVGGFIHFPSLDALRAFVGRCTPEDPAEFEADISRWNRGSLFCRLTADQYAKLHSRR